MCQVQRRYDIPTPRNRPARSVTRRVLASRPKGLDGCWDHPTAPAMVAGGRLPLSGWALVHNDTRRPRVVVLRDGIPIADIQPSEARADVEAAFGTLSEPSGWSFLINTAATDAGTSIEVVTYAGSERKSLGTRRLRAPVSFVGGALDVPFPGQQLRAGSSVRVAGWVLFWGRPAESVEIFIDSGPALQSVVACLGPTLPPASLEQVCHQLPLPLGMTTSCRSLSVVVGAP